MTLIGEITKQIADEYLCFIDQNNIARKSLITPDEYIAFRKQAISELPFASNFDQAGDIDNTNKTNKINKADMPSETVSLQKAIVKENNPGSLQPGNNSRVVAHIKVHESKTDDMPYKDTIAGVYDSEEDNSDEADLMAIMRAVEG